MRVPSLLCLSGHDPTGGAGVHADIEAAGAQGVPALSVITALTVQDSANVQAVRPVEIGLLERQLEALAADADIRAIKVGLLGDAAQAALVARWIDRLGVPCVLDPVLRAGGGTELAGGPLEQAIAKTLLPRVTLATPNAAEARRLAGLPGDAIADDAGATLVAAGCANVLVTGGDEPVRAGPALVVNTWHRRGAAPHRYTWPRQPETFHGAGCTLASAIAAQLVRGEPLEAALDRAQRWTQDTLAKAFAIGRGRRIPGRR
jgi:hydroxymethylpyrimidine/phosphomethylpyrimidine kinase